jgi:hypothetical protein
VLGPLAGQGGGARLHLCVGPRIGLRSAARLVAAGVTQVEPGFEALDTSFLDAMNKGATAADVVRSLRNLRSFGIYPHWNVLWALPGEDGEAHARAAARMPLLHHLVPPRVAYHVSIDRACPYHLDPARWGIRDVRRLPSYDDLFPEGADLDRIACHYVGDYGCASFEDPGRVRSLLAAVDDWQAAWQVVPPDLKVVRVGAVWALGDTREATGSPGLRRLSGRDEARRLLADGPLDGSAGEADLLAGGLALALDGQFVPLACAAPDVLEALANPV